MTNLKTVKFTPYQSDNFDVCLKLFKSNLRSYFADEEVADYARFLTDICPKKHYSCGWLNDQLVTCGGWDVQNNRVYLRWGIVDNALHKQHLGSQLMLYRLSHITQRQGPVEVFIRTSKDAQGFFEKHGFILEKVIKDGLVVGIDECQMRRPAGLSLQ